MEEIKLITDWEETEFLDYIKFCIEKSLENNKKSPVNSKRVIVGLINKRIKKIKEGKNNDN